MNEILSIDLDFILEPGINFFLVMKYLTQE